MSVAETLGRTSAGGSLRIGRFSTRRSVEVRVIVSGVEEDAFAASRPDTLAGALKPILKHLDDRTVVEMVGVEQSAMSSRAALRRKPLADLEAAIAFLAGR